MLLENSLAKTCSATIRKFDIVLPFVKTIIELQHHCGFWFYSGMKGDVWRSFFHVKFSKKKMSTTGTIHY